MKQFTQFTRGMLAPAVLAVALQGNTPLFAQFGQGPTEVRTVLTIKADGSSQVVGEMIESRTAAELQVRMMERFAAMSDLDADEMEKAAAKPETTETKPMSDADLEKKIREMWTERIDDDEGAGVELKVNVGKDTVGMVRKRSFASLEEMLKDGRDIWWQQGVSFGNVRFEQDTNGLLRVTLTPSPGMQRHLKALRSQMKMAGARSELRLVFPGKVVASGFPETQTNATWLAIDSKKDETLDAWTKLQEGPTVITAELGGLKVSEPLELKKLQRARQSSDKENADLPVTEAKPGFVAEAQAVTSTTLQVFPGGEEYFKSSNSRYGGYGQSTGTVVRAKLFAPKGRTFLSAGEIRVIKAVDDQGRNLAGGGAGDDDEGSYNFSSSSSDANSTPVQLHLQLPRPDAQAIEEITAETIAVTCGAWKEMTLTNIQENATNEIDLAAVLPGAKLAITKFSQKNKQLSLQARIRGPRNVERLKFKAKIAGADDDEDDSYLSGQNSTTTGGVTTRTVTISNYGLGQEEGAPAGSIRLLIQYPDDLRRERVRFQLKGLDLL